FSSTHSWSSAAVVATAKSFGVKVHFSVTLFGGHSALFNSTTKKNNLINNIMTQIDLRNADGCNVDFEAVGSSQATAFRTFLKQLGDTLKAHNKEFVVELYAVDWNTIFPAAFFSTLDSVVDYYFIMLYDYWYSGSTTAGPSAPLMATNSTSYYHVLRSIKAYTTVGCPADKIIAGFPSYGNDWPTSGSARQAATTASSTSRTYTVVKNNYIDTIAASNQFFDATFSTPWYRYVSGGTWRQVWYDDSLSWARKFDSIKVKNVAGTGMWALGYDGAEPEMWGALKTAFASSPNAAHTSFDDFETSVGHFDKYPRYSGTTVGIKSASTQALFNDFANNGAQSMEVVMKDSTEISTNWTVRILSGGGTPANNISFSTSGYIGFWLKTSSSKSGLQTAIAVDDGAGGSLISSKQTITADNAWHLYEWNLSSTTWTLLVGSDTQLNGPTATIDAVMLYAANDASDWTVYIDDVSRNSSSPLPVELVNFTGMVGGKSVHLNWRTATETDNYGFQVERREVSDLSVSMNPETSNQEWEYIGFVPG
ncbi:MAG: glycosyl hydrolase family 18 protein, partial [Bacteroidota bacterium]